MILCPKYSPWCVMTLEEVIVVSVRLLGSFPVLKYAFLGSIFAVLIDLSDLFILGNLDLGGVRNYQEFDKFLDLAYMGTFLLVSLRWERKEKLISIFLFAYRLIGLILFEFTGERYILLLFPNVFEFWIIGITFLKFRKKHALISGSALKKVFLISLFFKLIQEWVLHWNKFLDNYAMGDVISVLKDLI